MLPCGTPVVTPTIAVNWMSLMPLKAADSVRALSPEFDVTKETVVHELL